MRRLRTRAAILSAVTVLAGCSAPAVLVPQSTPEPTASTMMIADYPRYETVDDLVEQSDVVVTVTIGDSRYDVSRPIESKETDPALNPQAGVDPSLVSEDPGLAITVYQATTQGVHLGDLSAGDTIEVGRTGGILNGTLYQPNESPLARGGTYLLFLSRQPRHPAFVHAGNQGVFVPDDKGGFTSLACDGLSIDSNALAELR